MKKIITLILLSVITLIQFNASAESVNTSDAVRVAKAFCTAVYKNDMVTAKSYMFPDDARRTPDTIRNVDLNDCMQKFRKSSYKVIPSSLSDQIVTVRFFDPSQEYLSKQNRWFCCCIQLVYSEYGWKVTTYGY